MSTRYSAFDTQYVFGQAANNEIEEVDDTRAGIPLSATLHWLYASGGMAFLPLRRSNIVSDSSVAEPVPNSTVDADPNLPEHWVAHVFHPPPPDVTSSMAAAVSSFHGQLISLTSGWHIRPSWRLADWYCTQVVRVRFAPDDAFD